jgi:hypothetical protein
MGRHRTNHHGPGSDVGQMKTVLTGLSSEVGFLTKLILNIAIISDKKSDFLIIYLSYVNI